MLQIEDIQIELVEGSPALRARASAKIAGCIRITTMRVVEGNKGLFMAMPAKRDPNGEYHDIIFPTNRETRKALEERVLAAYRDRIAK